MYMHALTHVIMNGNALQKVNMNVNTNLNTSDNSELPYIQDMICLHTQYQVCSIRYSTGPGVGYELNSDLG